MARKPAQPRPAAARSGVYRGNVTMASDTLVTPAGEPPTPEITFGMILRMFGAFFNSAFVKLILGSILGGATAGYTVSHQVGAQLNTLPKGIIDKFLPPKLRAEDAIGAIRFGRAGCTATIIGPVEEGDDTIDILTAAHCVQVGQQGTMRLKDGRVFNVTCVTRSPLSDAAWLQAKRPDGQIPYLLLADASPPPLVKVWHQGSGIDKPGNKEEGTVTGKTSNGQQVKFRLSVSSGDSGGGIILNDTERVVSPVCCTSRLSAEGNVFGATPEACAAIRPRRAAAGDEGPLTNPILLYPVREFASEPES